jgi:uncharacterized damage-inducible protein DinB
MPRCDALIDSNVGLLRQGIELLARLDDEQYCWANPALELSSAGSHFRHAIDFFTCLLSSIESGAIDYDRRERNALIEVSRVAATDEMKKIVAGLERLNPNVGGMALSVVLEGTKDSTPSGSSLARELQFLLSHTIHHYALIAVALRAQQVEPGAEFGVAPSTLEDRKALRGHARQAA